MKKERRETTEGIELQNQESIDTLWGKEYNYLEAETIKQSVMKENIKMFASGENFLELNSAVIIS